MYHDYIIYFKDFSAIAAALGVVFGIIQFIRKTHNEMQARRNANIEKWREAAAYEIFRKALKDPNRKDFLSFEDFLSEMQKSAFVEAGIEIERNEINEKNVNLVLISMIEKRLIEPLGQDTYILKIDNINVESRGYTSHRNSPYRTILRLVRESKGEFTESNLMEALTHELGFDFQLRPLEFRRFLIELSAAGLIRYDEKGYLQIVLEADWARERGEKAEDIPEWARALFAGHLIQKL
jgi:hypothetical protein